MEGQPWSDLQRAFIRFLLLRESYQLTNDLVSVVQFDDSARIVHQGASLSTSVSLVKQNGGGTKFGRALHHAQTILKSQPWTQSPVLIFMSDGQAQDKQEDILNRITTLKDEHQLLLHTVGFGSGAGHNLLSVSLHFIIDPMRCDLF